MFSILSNFKTWTESNLMFVRRCVTPRNLNFLISWRSLASTRLQTWRQQRWIISWTELTADFTRWCLKAPSSFFYLELRQYKNGFVSVKSLMVLKLPRFFPCRVGEWKKAAISKQTCVSQKWVRSYIVLALSFTTLYLEHSNFISLNPIFLE